MKASSNRAVPPETVSKRRIASVTVNDVACLAGVSAMTVSRAINNPELRSPAIRAKLQAAIAEAGYVPNLVTGGLRTSKSRLLAPLVATLISPEFNGTIQAPTDALNDCSYPTQDALFWFGFGLTYRTRYCRPESATAHPGISCQQSSVSD